MSKSFLQLVCLVLIISCTCSSCTTEETSNKEDQTAVDTISNDLPIDTMVNIVEEVLVYDYDTSQWTELIHIDSSIVLDIRYATTNNFVEEVLYDCGRCFLRPQVARAVASANKKLSESGYRLKMFDCFRPLPVQQRLWDKFQNASYVTPPSKGSMHNRGMAVDLTIVGSDGQELDMGTAFDFFGQEAHHTYTGHSDEINKNRALLKASLEAVGFKGIRTEWWHYYFRGARSELSDMVWNCDLEEQ